VSSAIYQDCAFIQIAFGISGLLGGSSELRSKACLTIFPLPFDCLLSENHGKKASKEISEA